MNACPSASLYFSFCPFALLPAPPRCMILETSKLNWHNEWQGVLGPGKRTFGVHSLHSFARRGIQSFALNRTYNLVCFVDWLEQKNPC